MLIIPVPMGCNTEVTVRTCGRDGWPTGAMAAVLDTLVEGAAAEAADACTRKDVDAVTGTLFVAMGMEIVAGLARAISDDDVDDEHVAMTRATGIEGCSHTWRRDLILPG